MATSKVYVARGTPVVFNDTAGDSTLTLNNLAAGAARISDRIDLGAGSTPDRFQFRMTNQMATAGVPGQTIDLYVCESDGTLEDGDLGTTDAAVADIDSLRNLHYVGQVVVESAATDEDFRASKAFEMTSRYYSMVVHNNTEDNLKATNDVNSVVVTAIPPEAQ